MARQKTIHWHEVCLAQLETSTLDKIKKLKRLAVEIKVDQEKAETYSNQIQTAKMNNRLTFDRSNYMIDRG